MKNNGAVTGTISAKDEEYTIPQGHHDGSGKVGIAASEKEKLIPDNIREGITLLGVEGRHVWYRRCQTPGKDSNTFDGRKQSFRILMTDTIICLRLRLKQSHTMRVKIPLEVLR